MIDELPMMRAKLQVSLVKLFTADSADPNAKVTSEYLEMFPVCGNLPFGPNGESEENTFARYTPSGSLNLSITNPALFGKFKVGQKFYVDFTEATVPIATTQPPA